MKNRVDSSKISVQEKNSLLTHHSLGNKGGSPQYLAKENSVNMKKHEWRKNEKSVYLAKTQPKVIEIPRYKFITISGEGNPNSDSFGEYIEALYTVAYGIKMTAKKTDCVLDGHYDYTV